MTYYGVLTTFCLFLNLFKGWTERKLRKALHCKCSLTVGSLTPIFCLILHSKVQVQIFLLEIHLTMDIEGPSNCAEQYWQVTYVPVQSGTGWGHRCLGFTYNKPSVVTKVGLITTVFQNGSSEWILWIINQIPGFNYQRLSNCAGQYWQVQQMLSEHVLSLHTNVIRTELNIKLDPDIKTSFKINIALSSVPFRHEKMELINTKDKLLLR